MENSQSYPYLTTGHPFIFVYNNHYWSGTINVRYPDLAWVVNLGLGRIVNSNMVETSLYVWPVRGVD
jgi:hypothetical protein